MRSEKKRKILRMKTSIEEKKRKSLLVVSTLLCFLPSFLPSLHHSFPPSFFLGFLPYLRPSLFLIILGFLPYFLLSLASFLPSFLPSLLPSFLPSFLDILASSYSFFFLLPDMKIYPSVSRLPMSPVLNQPCSPSELGEKRERWR